MFIIRELHMPRSMSSNLQPQALEFLPKPFEEAIKEASFSFPYKPHNYYYVVTAREEDGIDDFLLIVDPELRPAENELFVSMIGGIPQVRKYSPYLHRDCQVLGTVTHASKAVAINTDPLD